MSRSTVAKSRAEKGGKSTNAPTPAVAHEIIPGKFNDQDWSAMVEGDGGEEFCLELVEEVCGAALATIYDNYLQRQLVPFTVCQAKDALLQIIEWQFLAREEGETNVESDPAWLQEDEPEPCVTDCWAQGSVPRQIADSPRAVLTDVEEEEAEEVVDDSAEQAAAEEAAQQLLLHRELADALPKLQAAKQVLAQLDKRHLTELKTFSSPPHLVQRVLDAVMILAGCRPTWPEARRNLGNPTFFQTLTNLQHEVIPDATLTRLEAYVTDSDFNPHVVGRVSKAAQSLCQWVCAMVEYNRVRRLVPPGSELDCQLHGSGATTENEESRDRTRPRIREVHIEDQPDHEPVRCKKFRPHPGKLKSAGVGRMTESLEHSEMAIRYEEWSASQSPTPLRSPDPDLINMPTSCHSIVKAQAGRPPGHREVMFDDTGNVVKIARINPARLPSHKVHTQFHVVDPAVEAAQARLEAMRTGRHIRGGARTKQQLPTRTAMTGSSKPQSEPTALPPPLLECMDVSPGVIVREGDRIKKGPKMVVSRCEVVMAALQDGLRPVTLQPAKPRLTVQDLLDQNTPTIRPLPDATPPIPPIQSRAEMV